MTLHSNHTTPEAANTILDIINGIFNLIKKVRHTISINARKQQDIQISAYYKKNFKNSSIKQ